MELQLNSFYILNNFANVIVLILQRPMETYIFPNAKYKNAI